MNMISSRQTARISSRSVTVLWLLHIWRVCRWQHTLKTFRVSSEYWAASAPPLHGRIGRVVSQNRQDPVPTIPSPAHLMHSCFSLVVLTSMLY